jgi:hypothetical protein
MWKDEFHQKILHAVTSFFDIKGAFLDEKASVWV